VALISHRAARTNQNPDLRDYNDIAVVVSALSHAFSTHLRSRNGNVSDYDFLSMLWSEDVANIYFANTFA
jgi:hypothetical protein